MIFDITDSVLQMHRCLRVSSHLSSRGLDLSYSRMSRGSVSFLCTTASGHRSESPSSDVLVESFGSIGKLVTLNRPKLLNALNLEMVHALTPFYQQWTHAGTDVVS